MTTPGLTWTTYARRRLEQVLFRVGREAAEKQEQTMDEINRALEQSFPNSSVQIVQDVLLGFRPREETTKLLVDVSGEGEGRYVVKVGSEEELRKELDAWNTCRPTGIRHDVVLMHLEPRHSEPADGTQLRLVSLVYEDAQQSIGMDYTVSLEDAFLGAVRNDDPATPSVANVIAQVLHRLGHLLYRAARPLGPAELYDKNPTPKSDDEHSGKPDIRLNGMHWLESSLRLWDERTHAIETRRDSMTSIGGGSGEDRFLDPAEYFTYILHELRDGKPPESFIPCMLRGKAHGDLHGRNVLVGLVAQQTHRRDAKQAHWPALFDYEDMARDNLLSWDFAKLETELKIRAYPCLFEDAKPHLFPRLVWEFETELSRQTEQSRRGGVWPPTQIGTSRERLQSLLLVIRSLASLYLGREHGRPDDWLEEYYFALACYGVYSARFLNPERRYRMGSFISAGTAAARFEHSRAPRR